MLISKIILTWFFTIFALLVFSQNDSDTSVVSVIRSTDGALPGIENQKQFQVHIKKTNEPIVVDGELKEETWKIAEVAQVQWNWIPQDS